MAHHDRRALADQSALNGRWRPRLPQRSRSNDRETP
jgi:hypothetical protein